MFEAESLVGYKVCKIGDIAANTMWLWAGAIGVSNDDGVISPSYNIYRQTDNVYDSDYLDILLRAIPLVQHYKALSTGIRPSRLRLYPPQFLNIKFPVPPMEEQKAIIDYLRVKLERIINSINRQKEIITKLEEYRKSIIYNAVTGKIDCRTENRTKSVNAVDTILKE
jgi:type I restriction enzyme S subunit